MPKTHEQFPLWAGLAFDPSPPQQSESLVFSAVHIGNSIVNPELGSVRVQIARAERGQPVIVGPADFPVPFAPGQRRTLMLEGPSVLSDVLCQFLSGDAFGARTPAERSGVSVQKTTGVSGLYVLTPRDPVPTVGSIAGVSVGTYRCGKLGDMCTCCLHEGCIVVCAHKHTPLIAIVLASASVVASERHLHRWRAVMVHVHNRLIGIWGELTGSGVREPKLSTFDMAVPGSYQLELAGLVDRDGVVAYLSMPVRGGWLPSTCAPERGCMKKGERASDAGESVDFVASASAATSSKGSGPAGASVVAAAPPNNRTVRPAAGGPVVRRGPTGASPVRKSSASAPRTPTSSSGIGGVRSAASIVGSPPPPSKRAVVDRGGLPVRPDSVGAGVLDRGADEQDRLAAATIVSLANETGAPLSRMALQSRAFSVALASNELNGGGGSPGDAHAQQERI